MFWDITNFYLHLYKLLFRLTPYYDKIVRKQFIDFVIIHSYRIWYIYYIVFNLNNSSALKNRSLWKKSFTTGIFLSFKSVILVPYLIIIVRSTWTIIYSDFSILKNYHLSWGNKVQNFCKIMKIWKSKKNIITFSFLLSVF